MEEAFMEEAIRSVELWIYQSANFDTKLTLGKLVQILLMTLPQRERKSRPYRTQASEMVFLEGYLQRFIGLNNIVLRMVNEQLACQLSEHPSVGVKIKN